MTEPSISIARSNVINARAPTRPATNARVERASALRTAGLTSGA
jgi:hypothetical protein